MGECSGGGDAGANILDHLQCIPGPLWSIASYSNISITNLHCHHRDVDTNLLLQVENVG